MLEKLLAYQPKEPRLLELRSDLLVRMERYPEAIDDLMRLSRLPDSDTDAISLRLAEINIEAGFEVRARELTRNHRRPLKAAELFRSKGLVADATAILEETVRRHPNDSKIWRRLARVQQDAREWQKAVTSLTKVLTLEGDRWWTDS